MKSIGFNFEKISIEKKEGPFKELKIKTNIDLSEIKEMEVGFFNEKEKGIAVKFTYKVDYEPDVANLEFKGTALFVLESEKAKELLNQWKDKKIPEEFKIPVFNTILQKTSIKALELENTLNLPLHIPLPRLQAQKQEEKQEKQEEKEDKETEK